MTKVCTSCGEDKPLTDYYKGKGKHGRRAKCKPCQLAVNSRSPSRSNEYYSEYRSGNRESIRENNRRYEQKMRGKYGKSWRTEYHREYYSQNKDKVSARRNKWLRDTGKSVEYAQRRRALLLNAEGDFTAKEFAELCDLYDGVCLACGIDFDIVADHVVPLSKGGSNSIDNIQPLCRSCNASKGAKHIDYRPTDKCEIPWASEVEEISA